MAKNGNITSFYLRLQPNVEYDVETLKSIWKLSQSGVVYQIDKLIKAEMLDMVRTEKGGRGSDKKYYMRIEGKVELPSLFYNIINNRLEVLNDKSSTSEWTKDDSSELKSLSEICKDLEVTSSALENAKKALNKEDSDDLDELSLEDATNLLRMKRN